jgi:hypothetical protein
MQQTKKKFLREKKLKKSSRGSNFLFKKDKESYIIHIEFKGSFDSFIHANIIHIEFKGSFDSFIHARYTNTLFYIYIFGKQPQT